MGWKNIVHRYFQHLPTDCRTLAVTLLLHLLSSLRPLLGPRGVCRFSETCTQYAHRMLLTQPLISAVGAVCYRLLRCGPLAYVLPPSENEKEWSANSCA